MTWLYDLYETYEVNSERVGVKERTRWGQETTLLPISHAYQNAQVEVIIKPNGDFFHATVVAKEEAATLIPVTIDSAGRTSSPSPHGLHDGLQYVAGDYQTFGGVYKKENAHLLYLEKLNEWCQSEYANPRVKSILTYLERGTLINDLLEEEVLVAKEGQLIAKWSASMGEKPPIFTVLAGDQFSTFIRFTVHELGSNDRPIWDDKQVMEDYVNYYTQKLKKDGEGIDYVTGKWMPLTENHPSKVRYGGDMAKLISGNDSTNFTYRGRFSDKNQVATIGYEVSQKGHNALKWLISRQGFTKDGRVFLVWNKQGQSIPTPEDSSYDFFFSEKEESVLDSDTTAQKFAELFQKVMLGYRETLDYKSPIQIMILDSATKGRMGILYYQTLPQQLYFDRLQNWHETCYWQHTVKKDKKSYTFFGAPRLKDIAEAAYGSKGSEAVVKNAIQKLYSCVVENNVFPRYLLNKLVERASSPVHFKEEYEWIKILNITCAVVIRSRYDQLNTLDEKNQFKECNYMELNVNETDRSYLFGRLLAIADVLEAKKLKELKQDRPTNAKKYMRKFSAQPLSTWKVIRERLHPYEKRMFNQGREYTDQFDSIIELFEKEGFSDKPLTGRYLEGYSLQKLVLEREKNKKVEKK